MESPQPPPKREPHGFLMKGGTSSDPTQISIEKLSPVKFPRNPISIKPSEYSEILKSVVSTFDNEDFYSKFLRALNETDTRGGVLKLTPLVNELTEKCIELQDADIRNIVDRLNRGMIEYTKRNSGIISPNNPKAKKAFEGTAFHASGIISVVNFIRTRNVRLSAQGIDFEIGFNNRFDALDKIDLIEIIYEETGEIKRINLVQIKSSSLTEKEQEQIIRAHKRFVNEIFKAKEIEDLRVPEETQMKAVEETVTDHGKMLEIIFDTVSETGAINLDKFLEKLKILSMTEIQIAYVFDHFFEEIMKRLSLCFSEGYINAEEKNRIVDKIISLREMLIRKSKIPTKITRVGKINSITSVGNIIVNDTNIYKEEGGNYAVMTS